jgi:hypothetical protein
VNREELNWLLETVRDAQAAQRFTLAQYERGRISFQVIADLARERGWITEGANQFLAMARRHSTNPTAPTMNCFVGSAWKSASGVSRTIRDTPYISQDPVACNA